MRTYKNLINYSVVETTKHTMGELTTYTLITNYGNIVIDSEDEVPDLLECLYQKFYTEPSPDKPKVFKSTYIDKHGKERKFIFLHKFEDGTYGRKVEIDKVTGTKYKPHTKIKESFCFPIKQKEDESSE